MVGESDKVGTWVRGKSPDTMPGTGYDTRLEPAEGDGGRETGHRHRPEAAHTRMGEVERKAWKSDSTKGQGRDEHCTSGNALDAMPRTPWSLRSAFRRSRQSGAHVIEGERREVAQRAGCRRRRLGSGERRARFTCE
jgi:hypothetical protein